MKTKTLTSITFLIVFCSNIIYSQLFSYSGSSLALNGTSLNNTNCTSNRALSINVSGVGSLSSSKQLLEINLTLTSNTRLTVAMYLKSPAGVCYQIASQLGDPAHFGQTGRTLQYKFRAPNTCLNKQPDYRPTSTPQHYYESNIDSRFGIFSTVSDISSVFNGVNANGTWEIYFSCTNTSYCSGSLPTISAASLAFGAPLSVSAPDPDAGKTCAGAIIWNGEPLCATTAGKTNTANRPGVTGCSWLATSENNLWIAFTPSQTNVCVNISGIKYISGTASGVQSIIVESATPCSGSWTVVNCPRDNVYASDVGSVLSHNHCFTATLGKTYYLVIDGNAGAITELYITGITGLTTILPVELQNFETKCEKNNTTLVWSTASENNNDYFTIEKSLDGTSWEKIGKVNGYGNSSSTNDYRFVDENTNDEIVYYRLSQTDFDGSIHVLKTKTSNCLSNKIHIVPNPNDGKFTLNNLERNTTIKIMDFQGRIVMESQNENNENISLDLSYLTEGMYLIRVENQNNEIEVVRFQIK
jgi:hypothetical protein